MVRRLGRRLALACALAALWPLAAAAGGAASIASSDPATIAHGRGLFAQTCRPCHGRQGEGEDPARPMGGWISGLGHLAPALNGSGHTWHHPPEYLFRVIRDGSTLAGSRMRGWAGSLGDYDILAVIAYFQSLWPLPLRDAYRERYLHRGAE